MRKRDQKAGAAARATAITIDGERWQVPYGFGAAYERIARDHLANERVAADVLSAILVLIGYDAPAEAVLAWPLRRRVEAQVYAASVHLRASDNPVPRCPKPAWLPEPWQGEWCDEMDGPEPTPIDGASPPASTGTDST